MCIIILLHMCAQVNSEPSWLLPEAVPTAATKNSHTAEAATIPAGASEEQSPRAVVAAAQPTTTTTSITSTNEPPSLAAASASPRRLLEPLLEPPSVACVGGDDTPNENSNDNSNAHDLGSHPEETSGSHNDRSTDANGTQQAWDPASFRWFWRMACEERQQMLPSSSPSSSPVAPESSTTSSSTPDDHKFAEPMTTEETTPSIAGSTGLLPSACGVEERSAAAVAITAASD